MSDFVSSHMSFQSDAVEEALLNELFSEMQQLNEQMKKDQVEIDRLTAETRAISAHTDALILKIEAQLDSLRKAA